tara:strand:- start:1861 stop:2370 length:510 start_codon:yes stop_codon:yes gene_type:complete
MATLILRDTYLELEKEMKSINKLRSETALKIQEAASHGDLKENYDYKAAKEQMEFVIYKKQLLQSHAPFTFIEYSEIKTEDVQFGNKVSVLEEGKKKADEYYLLGPIESELDLYPLVVTYHTPFAKAMIGKKINDYFTLEINGKNVKFTITAIEKITASTPKTSRDSIL